MWTGSQRQSQSSTQKGGMHFFGAGRKKVGHIFWSRTQKGGPYLFFGARRIKVGRDFYGAVLNFLWRSMHSWVHFFTEQYAKRYDDFFYGAGR